MTVTGCGGKTPIQPPPPDPILQLLCPDNVIREATSPQGTDVHFDPLTPTGGRPPYHVQCDPGSGSVFPIGDNTVRCTATDEKSIQVSCGFGVTVRVSQTLAKTKFTAFGDSITQGTISLAPLRSLAEPETYPYKLEQMLQQRYPAQPVVVLNSGAAAERTDRGALRLPGVLDTDKPDVVLILEGVNAVWLLSTSRQADAIRSMVQTAQLRQVEVILATVMPVTPQWEADGHVGSMSRIRALNDRIFQIAAELNTGPVVDLFSIFEANMTLIGQDGLHPTAEGQTRIAEAFREEIVRRYDMRTTSLRRFTALESAR